MTQMNFNETDSQTWRKRLTDMGKQTHRHGGTDSKTWGNRNKIRNMENRLVVAKGEGNGRGGLGV